MPIEKNVLGHVNDFFKGIYDTAIGAPIAFGDFAARLSGYRDYQINSGSVLELNSDLEQKQALNELKILHEAIKNDTSRNLIIDMVVQDIKDKPAYYLSGTGTTTAIGNTLNSIAKNTYKLSITGAKVTDAVHELYKTYKPNNYQIIKKELDKENYDNNQSNLDAQIMDKEYEANTYNYNMNNVDKYASSGQIQTDMFFNKSLKMQDNIEIISARLFFLGNGIKNSTFGVLDGSYSISHISGESGINKPYSYDIDFVSDYEISLSDMLNVEVKVKLRDDNSTFKSERYICGKVFKAQEISIEGKKRLYRIQLVSPFHYLYHNNRYKIYQNQTIIEIITKIISMSSHILNLQVVNKLDSMNYPQREYCTQYDQSDAEFILMLAQEEKISIIFDSSDNSSYKMILLNANSNAKRLENPLKCSYNLSKSYTSSHFVSSSYDHEQPSADYSNKSGNTITSSHYKDNGISSQFRHDLEVEKFRDRLELHGGSKSADLTRYGSLNSIQSFSGSELINGVSNSMYAQDSVFATLYEKEAIKTLDALIVDMKLEANFPNATDEYINPNNDYKYEVRFIASPSETVYIPPMTIKKPVISGVQTAIVASGSSDTAGGENTIDIDGQGRVRVIFHFDRDKPTSCYIRLGTLYTGNGWGAQFFPRVNTEVIVSFINGNIDKPIITGTVYNGNNAMPYSSPTQSYIKTRSTPNSDGYNELLFEDKANDELLSLRAQKDYKLHALNDSTINIDRNQDETVGNDETVTIGNNRTEKVGNDETISIGHDRKEDVGNDETIDIGNNRTETVGNNETIDIGNNQYVAIGNNQSLKIGSSQSVKIGSNLSTNIGSNSSLHVKSNSSETVRIAKALTVGAGYQVSVGGAKNETIGLSSTEQVGALKHIIAGLRYEVKVGASSLVLNADGTIILKGNLIRIDGATQVQVNGQMIDLN